ncbi:MAG: hypothetical protein ACR2OM_05790 [Aestuariivirgaceae bacterium]
MNKNGLAACTIAFGMLLLPTGEAAAKACVHSWAVPGTYTISGKFRGKVEAAGARLTRDCRVNIRVPGVSSNTRVQSAGKCLRFSFKVDGVKKAFSAKWCNTVGYIPWKGKSIRAQVKLVKRPANSSGGGRKKQNFN